MTHIKPDGSESLVPHLMSEDFSWKSKGAVSWKIAGPEQLHFRVYFDVEARGPYPPPSCVPVVGIGDNFRYNRPDGADPLQAMEAGPPVSADFDGDGLIDLVRPTIYGSTGTTLVYGLVLAEYRHQRTSGLCGLCPSLRRRRTRGRPIQRLLSLRLGH